MLVYRVDGSEINSAGCVDSADGEYSGGGGGGCTQRMALLLSHSSPSHPNPRASSSPR